MAGRFHQRKLPGTGWRAPLRQPQLQRLPQPRADSRGPNLANVYGSRLTLSTGQTITADDAYLRQSILNPSAHNIQGYAPIMPTYQGQISEEGVIALVEYLKNLNSDYRIQQTLTLPSCPRLTRAVRRQRQVSRRARRGQTMSAATIVVLPDQSTARIPKMNFITRENGLLSWLLTGDHKRIATLYLISITFFFFIGGALAGLIRLELLTPKPIWWRPTPITSCSPCTASS